MSTAPLVLPDAADAQPPLTQFERIADTFYAPSKTFADIRRNRSWWLPFLLLVLCGALFSGTMVQRLGPDGIAESALRANAKKYEQFKELPADQQAAQRRIIGKVTTYSLYSFPILQLVFAAFGALLLWVGFNFLLGGSSTWTAMFAVSIFASLPAIFRSLLAVVMLFVTDLDTFSLQDPVGSNPGYYLSASTAPWLHAFLGSFDLFTLWILALNALGGSIVARVKPAAGYALVFGAWFLYVLIKTGIAAAVS